MNRKGIMKSNAMQSKRGDKHSLSLRPDVADQARREERQRRTDRWEGKIKQGTDEGDKIRLRSQGGKGDSGNGPGEEMAKLQHTRKPRSPKSKAKRKTNDRKKNE